MLPLQSWAFLALAMLAVLCLAWLFVELDAALQRRVSMRKAAPSARTSTSSAADDDSAGHERPALRVIRGGASSRSDHGPTRVYDWVERGL